MSLPRRAHTAPKLTWVALAAQAWPQYLVVALTYGMAEVSGAVVYVASVSSCRIAALCSKVPWPGALLPRLRSCYFHQSSACLPLDPQLVDPIEPVQRAVYHASDAELWQYSYPFQEDTVPSWAIPFLAVGLPLLVLLVSYLAGGQTTAA